ncbi:hypothetical protein AYI69_g42 [Smittium culicis]|uniref:Uncharacterized protein n=1 Tax=Smittium culicis TaxID=133412 RepID=A0A1R1YU42_9FUNG|nr:hypothetical protein AYI69_g42 [Smittium culicis]
METDNISSNPQTNTSWSKVVSTNLKPSEGIATGYKKVFFKNENSYMPISIMEMVSGIKPKLRKIICMDGTPFKLGCNLKNLK